MLDHLQEVGSLAPCILNHAPHFLKCFVTGECAKQLIMGVARNVAPRNNFNRALALDHLQDVGSALKELRFELAFAAYHHFWATPHCQKTSKKYPEIVSKFTPAACQAPGLEHCGRHRGRAGQLRGPAGGAHGRAAGRGRARSAACIGTR